MSSHAARREQPAGILWSGCRPSCAVTDASPQPANSTAVESSRSPDLDQEQVDSVRV